MSLGAAGLLVAAIGAGRPLASLLAAGLFSLFMLLAVLVWTKFGQARPLAKCVVLSLLAHLLLLIYAYSTHVLYGPPGRWTGQIVKVRLRDAADDKETAPRAAPDPQPWQQAGTSTAPPLLAGPHPEEHDEPPTEAIPPAESALSSPDVASLQPNEAAAAPPTTEPTPPHQQPPQLVDLLPDEASRPAPSQQEAATDAPVPTSRPPADALAADSSTPVAEPPEQFVTATRSTAPQRLGDGLEVPEPLQARLAADRLQAAQPFGATPQTEAAVAAALDWLSKAQSADGRWDADAHGAGRETKTLGHDRRGAGAHADTGISGLALLAFLGSGETHLAGSHRETVQHGLEFLLASQLPDGSLAHDAELFAAMYCHGIATLALSEAYALTGDDRLLPGLQSALRFTMSAQSSAGGWRYRPNEPTDPGDMSQFGWQLMSLKSADLGGIPIPSATRIKMLRFLQSCSIGANRGLAGYRPGDRGSRTMTAEALVCRYFLGAENSPAALAEGAAFVMEERPSPRAPNYYYWYYGTLAMFQRQGDEWHRWNAALQAELLARQRWDAAAAGSYDPDDVWGGYGGRVYSTALAALCLEVYYRYLPVHGRHLDDSRLTDRPSLPAVAR